MTAGPTAELRDFAALAGRWRLARLGALTLAAAASEGVGLVLLVPLVGGLLAGGGAPAILGRVLPAPLLAAGVVALVAARALLEGLRALAAQDAAAAIVDGLRGRVMAALLAAEWAHLARLSRSDQRALLIGVLDRAGEALHQLVALLRAAALLGALALAAGLLDWRLGAAAAAGALALAALARPAGRTARLIGARLAASYRALDGQVDGTLAAIRTLKSHGAEAAALRALDARLGERRALERSFVGHGALRRGLVQTGAALALAALALVAAGRGQAAPATLIAGAALALRSVPLLEALQAAWQGWQHARPAFAELAALEAGARAAAEPAADPVAPPRLAPALVFEAVSVRHAAPVGGAPGAAVAGLEAVSLTIPRGAIAVVSGPSGAGKSTLADCAGGLRAPDAGRILVGGEALTGARRIAWRRRVAYVEQSPVLLAASVRANLLLADPAATEPALWRALAAAAASDFVAALPDGLDTPVGDGGRVLSGGERQRLALARALLRDPDLLILDEATSALDPATDAAIAGALRGLKAGTSVLIIAHRGALSACADLRFTLEGGRLNGEPAVNSL